MNDFIEQAVLGLQRVNQLSSASRRALPGDQLFLLALFANDLATGSATLISGVDSNASRIAAELKLLIQDEHVQQPPHGRVVIVDSTTHGVPVNSTELTATLPSVDFVLEFGPKSHTEAQSHRLKNAQFWPTQEKKVPGIEGCTLFYRESIDSLPFLEKVMTSNSHGAIFGVLMNGLRTATPEALVTAARNAALLEANKIAEDLRRQIIHLSLENAGLRDNVIGAEATVGTLNWKLERLNAHLNHLQNELKIAREDNDAIFRSRTFRLGRFMTLPLRAIRKILRKLR